VTITAPTPTNDTVRVEAAALGAALVRRGEGIVVEADRRFTFSATTGGALGRGQLLRYDAVLAELTCVAESTDRALLDMPDNLVVAPWGQLFLAENGSKPDAIRCLTSSGAFCDVALQSGATSEISGVCFSPAGDALFCNIQQEGLTLAITGPFQATFDV
jgi:uncharacterized protein